ncbi:hypothetical protein PSP6_80002 [Paraburkholderia tropica]|nr:hypothetical protein PSP6_80002 [Paraburkholderia tropica]
MADYRLTLPLLADPLRFLTLFSQMSIARSEATRYGRDYWQPSHTVNPFSTGRRLAGVTAPPSLSGSSDTRRCDARLLSACRRSLQSGLSILDRDTIRPVSALQWASLRTCEDAARGRNWSPSSE